MKRFLCNREGSYTVSNDGFLCDPDGEYGRYLNPNVIAFDDLLECPCLVVLGEPGIGKSSELDRAFDIEAISAKSRGNKVLSFKLRQYQTDDFLCREIFESEIIKNWKEGTQQLHLFLDDLDEGLLSINTLAALLGSKLKDLPKERLNLRIACRTAEWPQTLERELKIHWGEQEVKIMELVPLRLNDVAEFAATRGLDPDQFIRKVIEKEVVPLAIKPLTLKFLTNIFCQNRDLPKTQAELYEAGCRQLCEEFNDSRIDAGKRYFLSPDQLLAVAERIAAVTIFANRAAIRTRPDLDDISDSGIEISTICGRIEEANGVPFQITEECIREAVKTGLFTSRGLNRMGWAHQTYAEFLAARYIKRHRMNISQAMNLLTHPLDDNRRLVPQLHETAAWLAGMDKEIYQVILQADPEVLLRSDITTSECGGRQVLVEKLLGLFEQDDLLDDGGNLRSRYRKLNHTNIADQLRPYICDVTKGLSVRQVAIDIAEACEVKELQNELAAMALDISQPMTVRIDAAYAVTRIGDTETRARLKPLAFGEAGDDPDDQLKGCGLRAIWPEAICADELFFLLSFPKRPHFHGSYSQFLLQDCPKHLKSDDLVVAFDWIDRSGIRAGAGTTLSSLREKIIVMAWKHLDRPQVCDRLTTLIAKSLRRIDNWNDDIFTHNESKRYLVLEALIPKLAAPNIDLSELSRSKSPLLRAEDLPFLLSLLKKEPSTQGKQILIDCIKMLFDINNLLHTELIINESSKEDLLAMEFEHLLQFVDLGSAEAKSHKSNYYEWLKRQSRFIQAEDDVHQKLSIIEAIAIQLDRCESGEWEAWYELNKHMTLSPENGYMRSDLDPDLRSSPGWQYSDSPTRSRILEAAKGYLSKGELAYAGYRALLLLYHEDRDYILALGPTIWKKWALSIVAYPLYSKTEEEPHLDIVKLSYQRAPEETSESLIKLIDEENTANGFLVTLKKFKHCWDEKFVILMEAKLTDGRLKPACFKNLLEALLDHRSTMARRHAESVITHDYGEKMEMAAATIFTHTEDCGWSVVWPLINQNSKAGISIMSSVAGPFYRNYKDIFNKLKASQLSQLYIWLEQQFPHKEDPDLTGHRAWDTEDFARRFRNSVLEFLKESGTKEAVNEIKEIAAALPSHTWLKWTILRAQKRMRETTWQPLQPETIIELAANRQKRLVQNGEQLLEMLIESLDRLLQKLHGETPAVADLWNQLDKRRFQPTDENHLSDYVKRHLEEDLKGKAIVLNREVEIRRNPGSPLGERTDIRVDAISHTCGDNEFNKISAIVETKGCWNRELNDGMEIQLKARYLTEASCKYGLYLVGWFICDEWDSTDRRRAQSPKVTMDELVKQLAGQADSLSIGGFLLKSYVLNAALEQQPSSKHKT